MVLEQVMGLSATNITLDERFTYLSKRPRLPRTQKWQPQPLLNPALIEQIARQLEFQFNQPTHMQRFNYRGVRTRRYSEGSVNPSLFRTSSMNSLNENWDSDSFASWKGSTGNLSTISSGTYFKIHSNRRGRRRGFYRGVGMTRIGHTRLGRPNVAGRQAGRSRSARGRSRGQGKLDVSKNEKPVPTKQQLDDELDQYMAACKSRLDKDLDEYRRSNELDVEMLE